MVQWKRFILLILAANSSVLAGCSGRAASPGKNVRSATAALLGQEQRASKPAPREGAFSVYNNPGYGVSFRYPRNYALEEGEPEEGLPDIKSQEELEGEQPGATLLATVVIPEDAYPNTTFLDGSLQFAVNPSITAESCRDFVISRAGNSGTTTIQGVLFAWEQDASATADTEVIERDYAGYAGGACYEFFVRVTVGEAANNDGSEKQADAEKIVRHLEKIASSLQMPVKAADFAVRKVPE
jgi:hypothetical protein